MHDPNQDIYDRACFLLDEVEARLEEGFPDEGLQIARQVARLLDRHQQHVSVDLRVDAQYCLASCHFELHDVSSALLHYDEVRALDPSDHEIDYWYARALFHGWQFQAAEKLLADYRPCNATRAGALYYRALLRDFSGDTQRADLLFSRAQREQPVEFPRPLRLSPDEMQRILAEVVGNLPQDVQNFLQDVAVALELRPDPAIHASPDIDPLSTCLYRRATSAALPGSAPAIIEVFQRNLELLASDRDELQEEVRLSLLEQIGQHVGRSRQGSHLN